jgi:hypothetical protein
MQLPLRSDPPSAQPADHLVWTGVTRKARCAESALHPDQWFPVSPQPEIARREAAGAIAICSGCPVRAQCHLRKVFRKLGVTSRTQLVSALPEGGAQD